MTTVLFLAPGYPDEMPLFVRGLARAGATVYGLSDVAVPELPEMTRRHLAGYLQSSLRDEPGTIEAVRRWVGSPGGPSGVRPHRLSLGAGRHPRRRDP
jgi:predicted naringenin-chalcone synthase